MPVRSRPTPLVEVLAGIAAKAENGKLRGGLAAAAWPLIAGSELAARSRVKDLARGRLVVEVFDTAWKTAFERMAPELLARARTRLPGIKLAAIEVRVGAPIVPVPAPPPVRRSREAAPKKVADAARAIADADLRERALATAARYLARRERSGQESARR